jgi:hypothetical protein
MRDIYLAQGLCCENDDTILAQGLERVNLSEYVAFSRFNIGVLLRL